MLILLLKATIISSAVVRNISFILWLMIDYSLRDVLAEYIIHLRSEEERYIVVFINGLAIGVMSIYQFIWVPASLYIVVQEILCLLAFDCILELAHSAMSFWYLIKVEVKLAVVKRIVAHSIISCTSVAMFVALLSLSIVIYLKPRRATAISA